MTQSAMDQIMESDDPRVQEMLQECGPLVADYYMKEYNNACVLITGFERTIHTLVHTRGVMLAPLANMSISIN